MRQIRAKLIRSRTSSRQEYRAGKRYYIRLGEMRAQNPKRTNERKRASGVHHVGQALDKTPPLRKRPIYDLLQVAHGSTRLAGWAFRSALREVAPGLIVRRHSSINLIAGSIPSHTLQSASIRAQEIIKEVLA